ncbi:hypothetical protein H696_02394 [Fonticula alba]|uniref:Uncharacterized protein n=1 Tax=Fonticula alba TaxID=691883 RepID=A0A058ZDD2_FONAL|nr:hypothetical protein H696_02394 [Fonticula alba]KCV71447.1 hypothetical protein H696_02394 [Fonticula alba]|eukprot:XP_009494570.1 hypothetical protein H696_02394 [Fonticula alba]
MLFRLRHCPGVRWHSHPGLGLRRPLSTAASDIDRTIAELAQAVERLEAVQAELDLRSQQVAATQADLQLAIRRCRAQWSEHRLDAMRQAAANAGRELIPASRMTSQQRFLIDAATIILHPQAPEDWAPAPLNPRGLPFVPGPLDRFFKLSTLLRLLNREAAAGEPPVSDAPAALDPGVVSERHRQLRALIGSPTLCIDWPDAWAGVHVGPTLQPQQLEQALAELVALFPKEAEAIRSRQYRAVMATLHACFRYDLPLPFATPFKLRGILLAPVSTTRPE